MTIIMTNRTLHISSHDDASLMAAAHLVLTNDHIERVIERQPDGTRLDISRDVAFAMRDYLRSEGWRLDEDDIAEVLPDFLSAHLMNSEIFK